MQFYTDARQDLQPTLCNSAAADIHTAHNPTQGKVKSCTHANYPQACLRQSQQLHNYKLHSVLPEAISTAARLHLRGTAEVRLWSCLMACCRCTCVARAACPMRDTAPRAMRGPSLPCIPSAKTRRRNSSEPALFAESAMPAVTDMAAITQVHSRCLCLAYGIFVNQVARVEYHASWDEKVHQHSCQGKARCDN